MWDFLRGAADLVWPLAVATAWVAGELGHRSIGLPRISIYGLVGFVLSHAQIGILPRPSDSAALLLANISLGLILFEFGYRINLRWLRTNPWVGAAGLLKSSATFLAVYAMAKWSGMQTLVGLSLASLAMATSPAEVLRVVNEQRSSGQVTERALHLSALNCVLAVCAFNVVVGLWTLQNWGSWWQAAWNSLVVLFLSAAFGTAFGLAVPGLLRMLGTLGRDSTVAFAVAVILLVALAHTLKVSPVLASLIFGFVARHRRLTLSQAQRNFGALGDLLTVLLFVFVAATLAWQRVLTGIDVALGLICVRLLAKVVGAAALSHIGGISWRKGVLTGFALAPMSVLVISLLVQARYLGMNLFDPLAPLAAATLLMHIIGPVLTTWALKWAHEAPSSVEH